MRLEDAIDFMLDLNDRSPRENRKFKTGLYIETKSVGFYKQERNVDIAKLLYEVLEKYDLETVEKAAKKLPIIIQSFEQDSLLYFKTKTNLPTVQLMWDEQEYDLEWVTSYANGAGPKHTMLFNYDGEEYNLYKPSRLIEKCHELGMQVHPYTLQDDKLVYASNEIDEMMIWEAKGIDGVFTEFPRSTLSILKHSHSNRILLSGADQCTLNEDSCT